MKKYLITITEGPKKNDGINMRSICAPKEVTKREFLKLKRSHLRDKKRKYSIQIIEGGKAPLLPRERVQVFFKNLKRLISHKKTIEEMQIANTKRDYYDKKYKLIIIILTIILTAFVTSGIAWLINKYGIFK